MEGENRGGPHAAHPRGSRADDDWDRFPPDASARAPRDTLRHARQASRDSSADGTPRADLCSPARFLDFFPSFARGIERSRPVGRRSIGRPRSPNSVFSFRSFDPVSNPRSNSRTTSITTGRGLGARFRLIDRSSVGADVRRAHRPHPRSVRGPPARRPSRDDVHPPPASPRASSPGGCSLQPHARVHPSLRRAERCPRDRLGCPSGVSAAVAPTTSPPRCTSSTPTPTRLSTTPTTSSSSAAVARRRSSATARATTTTTTTAPTLPSPRTCFPVVRHRLGRGGGRRRLRAIRHPRRRPHRPHTFPRRRRTHSPCARRFSTPPTRRSCSPPPWLSRPPTPPAPRSASPAPGTPPGTPRTTPRTTPRGSRDRTACVSIQIRMSIRILLFLVTLHLPRPRR